MAEYYLGFDLSTQQLKGIAVKADLKLAYEAKVDFDADLSKYGIKKGVLTNPAEGEIFAPVAMWLDAIDLVLQRLKEQGLEFSKVKGISGAGMQHGTVFWSKDGETLLEGLDAGKTLLEQLEGKKSAFSHPYSPNWQDASTQEQCDAFDGRLGSQERLAEVTGSKAHHRFSGPQIMRFRQKHPESYAATARISLVSSFLASIFLGKVAPIDIGDVCGMNLWDIKKGGWHEDLIALAAGDKGVAELKAKLGQVPEDGGASFGSISPYFVRRYNFSPSTSIVPFTGDNPSTILALPLRASDAIVSLGTSTTFLMSTPQYKPDPAYHFMNHPATAGLYMFMLCYKNGGLAREHIRDALNSQSSDSNSKTWDNFNQTATSTPVLGQTSSSSPMRLGLFFPRPEIVPNVKEGTWRYLYDAKSDSLTAVPPQEARTKTEDSSWPIPEADARAILESQFLSLRLRSQNLVHKQGKLPPQPRRIYLVGGGAANPAIAQLAGEVLGGAEGVFKLDIGGNACALGSAYKAAWTGLARKGEDFEAFVEERWNEEGFVKKIADGYREGVWEKYGEALKGFEEVENRALEEKGEGRGKPKEMGSAITRDRDPTVKHD
ncbi:D-xylulose kinase-like protein [Mytilinidion resinicola]|uniref:Xylulose kinase n=1 Tax=Mytilinidion resinicola TaxID=574789 RepID=A0A6A6Z183_9PEZI|nr:D-xylulose kinase-like protein [Mytilinidion resinicola]KAF2814922.1 D-xylulose kinase-like protein [Mytilinidion resinicola]